MWGQYSFFALVGLIVVVMVLRLLLKDRTVISKCNQKLETLGFAPCPDETKNLEEKIARIENNSEYHYRVRYPVSASLHRNTVYYYTKALFRHVRETGRMNEFLIPLERRSKEGILLFIKPSSISKGMADKFVTVILTGQLDVHPNDLVKIDIPVDSDNGNLISVFGPKGSIFHDLIDNKTSVALGQLGDCGIIRALCRDSWITVSAPSIPSSHSAMDVDRLLSILSGWMVR